MSEKYVIVHRTHDPFQADLLGDLLQENGIAARVLGTRHGAAIGVGQNILQQHIEVPLSQAGEATDFLESYFESDGAELLEDELEDESDPGAAPADEEEPQAHAALLRPLFAAGAALLLFGGSHLYVRRPWTTLILAAGQVVALANFRSLQWHTAATGLVMFVAILFIDLCGGQVAVRAYNRKVQAGGVVRRSPVRQVAMGALFVALAGGMGMLLGPLMPQPERPEREDHQGTGPMAPAVPVDMAPQPGW